MKNWKKTLSKVLAFLIILSSCSFTGNEISYAMEIGNDESSSNLLETENNLNEKTDEEKNGSEESDSIDFENKDDIETTERNESADGNSVEKDSEGANVESNTNSVDGKIQNDSTDQDSESQDNVQIEENSDFELGEKTDDDLGEIVDEPVAEEEHEELKDEELKDEELKDEVTELTTYSNGLAQETNEENEAFLNLVKYSKDELEHFPVLEMLGLLKDSSGNSYSIDSSATTLWRHSTDKEDKLDTFETYSISEQTTINLYPGDDITEYRFEIIVGKVGQLNKDNQRYIVLATIADVFDDAIETELYLSSASGRQPLTPSSVNFWVSTFKDGITELNYDYAFPGSIFDSLGSEGDVLLNIKSEMAKNPRVRVEVYSVIVYGNAYITPRIPITDRILNQDMKKENAGFIIPGDKNTDSTYLIDTYVDDELYSSKYLCVRYWQWYPKHEGKLFKLDENNEKKLVYSNTSSDFDSPSKTTTISFELDSDYSEEDEFYFDYDFVQQKNYGDGQSVNWDVFVNKIYTGHYNSIEEAIADNAKDVTDDILCDEEYHGPGNGYKAVYGGEGLKFTVFKKVRASSSFPLPYDTLADKIIVKAVRKEEPYKFYDDIPTVGELDPWFRITGALGEDGESLDTYVVENGKKINMDTLYGYGYQTIFINKYLSQNELKNLRPTFWYINEDRIDIRENEHKSAGVFDGKLQESGITVRDFSSDRTQQYSAILDGEKVKNYMVNVVSKSKGPKLYVNGPVDDDGKMRRSVFLNEYFEYKHDILIANIGDEILEDLDVKLDAVNVKLDEYWTVGGEGNNTLAPFENANITSGYGLPSNLAKIRLLPDGDGEVSGTLTISAKNCDPIIIYLSGRAENPGIVTDQLERAVKYVPYSYFLSTNNMYDWNTVDFTIESGNLPDGLSLYSSTGEIYGAPKESGIFTFTVKASYSDAQFDSSEREYSLQVDSNEDEIVFNTSDDKYAIIPEEDSEIGFVGEQVSDYRFEVLDTDGNNVYFDINEVYISEGDYYYFEKLWLNGTEVDTSYYDYSEGSTKIVISREYLEENSKKGDGEEGRNTISAEFNIDKERGVKLRRTSQNYYLVIRKETDPQPIDTPEDERVEINTVIQNENGQALSGYTVEMHSTVRTSKTNKSGVASFSGIELGKHTVYVKNDKGKTLASKHFTLVSGKKLTFNGDKITVVPGQTLTLTITIKGSDAEIVDVTSSQGNKLNKPSEKEISTGDKSDTVLWGVLLLVSLIACGILKQKTYKE